MRINLRSKNSMLINFEREKAVKYPSGHNLCFMYITQEGMKMYTQYAATY